MEVSHLTFQYSCTSVTMLSTIEQANAVSPFLLFCKYSLVTPIHKSMVATYNANLIHMSIVYMLADGQMDTYVCIRCGIISRGNSKTTWPQGIVLHYACCRVSVVTLGPLLTRTVLNLAHTYTCTYTHTHPRMHTHKTRVCAHTHTHHTHTHKSRVILHA